MSEKPAYEKKAMTAFAQAALAASDLINTKFSSMKFTGPTPRVVKVEAPKVESTSGGKKARESIVLTPESGNPAAAITVGFLDVGVRACELRSYAALNAAHRERFAQPLDLHQSEYDKFFDELKELLEAEGFVIKVIEPEERQARAAAVEAKETQSNTGVMIAIGMVAALVVVGLIMVFVVK